MPELPDIIVYREALLERLLGQCLLNVQLQNPFLLRTATPPLESALKRRLERIEILGKRLAFGFEDDLWLVLHLMIAGRLHWMITTTPVSRSVLLALDFNSGRLTLTEAGTKRRAALHVCASSVEMRAHDPGGHDVFALSLIQFKQLLTAGNHTLKRVLTDPHIFSGIGNAYSDEILHAAQLSPIAHSQKLSAEEIERLYTATGMVLEQWTARLRDESHDQFPEKVTAFHSAMAVHGKYQQPCPHCTTSIQRIRYADNETNYCPRCQTGGRMLADRALSRLLKADWPKSIDAWETHQRSKVGKI